MVVTPPRTPARVSVSASTSNDSSLPIWTCGSKSPGMTILPRASKTSSAAPDNSSASAVIRPPAIPTSAVTEPTPGMTTVP